MVSVSLRVSFFFDATPKYHPKNVLLSATCLIEVALEPVQNL